jgi:hypothetical protein
VNSVAIQGRTLTFPIEVRKARSWAAQFLVDARAAQAQLPPGLEVVRIFGRAMLVIPVVRYEDSDLDSYNELGIAFLVRRPGSKGPRVFIKHLPVTQEFTLEAGRTIWGYPKFIANIDIVEHPGGMRATLTADGARVLTLDVRRSLFPMPARTLPTYTYLNETLRETNWDMPGVRARGRLGGGNIQLWTHPIADELRALGLPKRAFATQTVAEMRAVFGPAETIT